MRVLKGTLIEVIDRLDEIDDSDRYETLEIYAGEGDSPEVQAVICPGDEEGKMVCPLDSSLSYVLMVEQAKDAIEVWSEWRGGKVPSAKDKYEAVMFYSRNDAYLPVEKMPRV